MPVKQKTAISGDVYHMIPCKCMVAKCMAAAMAVKKRVIIWYENAQASIRK